MDITKLKPWDEITLRNGLVGSFIEFEPGSTAPPGTFYLRVLFIPGYISCVHVDEDGFAVDGISLFDVVKVNPLKRKKPHIDARKPAAPRKWWQF